jgi:hypothetical protein
LSINTFPPKSTPFLLDYHSLSAGSFPAPKIGPQKKAFFSSPQTSSLQAASPKLEKKGLILAKMWHNILKKGLNIKFKMTFSSQEMR